MQAPSYHHSSNALNGENKTNERSEPARSGRGYDTNGDAKGKSVIEPTATARAPPAVSRHACGWVVAGHARPRLANGRDRGLLRSRSLMARGPRGQPGPPTEPMCSLPLPLPRRSPRRNPACRGAGLAWRVPSLPGARGRAHESGGAPVPSVLYSIGRGCAAVAAMCPRRVPKRHHRRSSGHASLPAIAYRGRKAWGRGTRGSSGCRSYVRGCGLRRRAVRQAFRYIFAATLL
uniref:Uncharacterized protein n=1 Tax=Setaria viridis TaxID=4556 RepID=A0A4U6USB4_SETVI|nr:hypothetical protein SEVIR_5G368400v2 [Setaria viridis]